jgi:hypothetical protein
MQKRAEGVLSSNGYMQKKYTLLIGHFKIRTQFQNQLWRNDLTHKTSFEGFMLASSSQQRYITQFSFEVYHCQATHPTNNRRIGLMEE